MIFLPEPTRDKLISWDQTPVRWLIFYYLSGLIVAVYFIGLEEWLMAIESPRWIKVVFTTAIFPSCYTAASVWLHKKGWLR